MRTLFKSVIAFALSSSLALAANVNVVFSSLPFNANTASESTGFINAAAFRLTEDASITDAHIYIGGEPNFGIWNPQVINYSFFDDTIGSGGIHRPSATPITGASGVGQITKTEDTGVAFKGQGQGQGNVWRVDFNLQNPFPAIINEDYWFGIHLADAYGIMGQGVYWVGSTQTGSSWFSDGENLPLYSWRNNGIGGTNLAFELTATTSVIPIPSAWLLFGSGVLSLIALAKGSSSNQRMANSPKRFFYTLG